MKKRKRKTIALTSNLQILKLRDILVSVMINKFLPSNLESLYSSVLPTILKA